MKNFRISSLEIHEIGPFGNLTIHFPEKPEGFSDKAEIHILTGENGTGKTTVLEILAEGIAQKSERIRNKFHREKVSGFDVKFSSKEFIKWNSELTKTGLELTPDSPLSKYVFNFERKYEVAFFAYSGYRNVSHVHISGIQELDNNPFENALDFQKSVNPQFIIQWIANTITKEALAKNQSDAKEATRFRSSISNLEKAIAEIIDKSIRFVLEYNPLGVIIEVNNERLNFNQLPDGLKSIVSWIADLLMRMDRVKWVDDIPVFERNFILFLDEIEVHLHPAWQRKILPAVQKLFPNAQIFISTHSPFVVGSVDGAWIHKLVKPNGDSQLAGPPILSEDANSFRYWLDEVFDIKKEFGEGAQNLLDEFYQLRDVLLVNGSASDRKKFARIVHDLSKQSREMEAIISWEVRQFNKHARQPINP